MLVWDKKDGKQGIVQAKIEYREMDFYGPFLYLDFKEYKDETIVVTPTTVKTETAEVSENDFSLLAKASREIYQEIGSFILKTKFFEVKITSEETEDIIIEELKKFPLF